MKAVRLQSKASDIKFRHVGNRVHTKNTRRSVVSQSDLNGVEGRHPNETDPAVVEGGEWAGRVGGGTYKYSVKEDTRVSRFTHHQLLLVEKNILVLALLVIFLGMIKIEADVLFPSGSVSDSIMLVISCTTFMLVFLVVLRKVLGLQLEIDQRRVYTQASDLGSYKSSLLKVMRDRDLLLSLLLEILIILPHPMRSTQGWQYTIFDENQGLNFVYEVNDMLNVLMMAKIYLVFRSLVAMSIYTSPRAVRLCSYSNIDHSWFFSLKCIQQEYPLAFTTVISLVFLFIMGIGFRVTEGNLYYLNRGIMASKTGFEDYSTCLWFTFITMTSIGYGEYSPITFMGRLLAGFIAIFGVILNSFLVVALTEYLRMKTGEIRSHTTTLRLGEQKHLFNQSAVVVSETIQTTQMITQNVFDAYAIKKLQPIFVGLKTKIDMVKAHNKHIKRMLPQSNKTELMIHEFELVKDNFKEVYKLQQKMKGRIERIEELKGRKVNREVHQRFLEEVNMLLD